MEVLKAIKTVSEDPKPFLTVKNAQCKEFLQTLSVHKCTTVWECLLNLCLSTIDRVIVSEDSNKLTIEDDKDTVLSILNEITMWIHTYITCVENPVINQTLVHIGQTLHDTMLSLFQLSPKLTNSISLLCETWWTNDLQDKELLVTNMILYVLSQTLYATAKVSVVKRLWSIRHCLLLLDFEDTSANSIKEMLTMATYNPIFLKSDEGLKFVSFLFGLHPSFVNVLHNAIKLQLPGAPQWLLEIYGKIYFRAWRLSESPYSEQLELHCIQDLMYDCIHAPWNGTFQALKTVLGQFHQQNTRETVQDLLYRLYKPFLWRSLKVANGTVRANAITLMLDAFPLYDPKYSKEDVDKEIQRQFDLMKDLLKDPDITVRSACVVGVCHILSCYWEMIPVYVTKGILTIIISELAFDVTSSSVRVAVLQGLSILLEQRLSHSLLESLLPSLGGHLHDVAEKVRLAFLDMLILIKNMRSIKYWKICPVDHLLARMEVDSPSVVKRIVALLLDSFRPSLDPASHMKRCIVLVRSNPYAAWQFYYHAVSYMSKKEIEKFTLNILQCIRSNIGNSSEVKTALSDDEDVSGQLDNMETVAESADNMIVGMLEIIAILLEGLKSKDKSKNELILNNKLKSEIKDIFPLLSNYFQDSRGQNALYIVGSFLPKSFVGPLFKGTSEVLSALQASEDPLAILLAMMNWKQEAVVVRLVQEGLKIGLQRARNGEKENTLSCGTETTEGNTGIVPQPNVTLEILNLLIIHPVLFHKIKDLPDLWGLGTILHEAFDVITENISQRGTGLLDSMSQMFLMRCISVYIRLAMHRQIENVVGGDGGNFLNKLEEVICWCNTVLLPLYSLNEQRDQREKASNNRKRKINQSELDLNDHTNISQLIIESLLTLCSDFLLCGLLDSSVDTLLVEFAINIIEKAGLMTFLPNIAKLLYQLIEVASTMCIGEIVNSASLLQTTRLLDKVLSELRCISETQSNLFYKAWPNIKPVLVKALTVSQHHSVLSITSSSLPIYMSLAKAVLSCYVDQLKINPNLPVPSDTSEFPQYIQALFSVSSNNKRLLITHLEQFLLDSDNPNILLFHLSSLHIANALSTRFDLVKDLLHLVHFVSHSATLQAHTSQHPDIIKDIQELSDAIQRTLVCQNKE